MNQKILTKKPKQTTTTNRNQTNKQTNNKNRKQNKTKQKTKNQKKNRLFPKFQLISILRLQVLHEYVHWH